MTTVQAIRYVNGDPFLCVTEGTWRLQRRTHARAPWRPSETIVVQSGCHQLREYVTQGENALVRVVKAS